jgi:NhaP-type Na+/H+ or K+/H+ antiporter
VSNHELSIVFFLALAAILLACRLVGYLARYVGQPQVVGEMIAGVLLGPSLLGWIAPQAQAVLFPKAAMPVLYVVAQIGLVLYMFLVGLDFDVELLRKRARSAVTVSWAGILTPFALGALLAWAIHGNTDLFAAGVSTGEAALFMGASMSITAFPMLARIIYERGLSGTSMGTLALAAGSADDAAAWCILAVVLASFSGHASIAVWAIGGGLAFGLFAFFVLKSLLARAGAWVERKKAYDSFALPGALTLLAGAAWYTDIVGIYAASVYLASLPGGWVADRWLGLQRSVWYGGIFIALGHLSIGLSALLAHQAFFLGLVFIVIGTGLLKPNISAIVGNSTTNAKRSASAGSSGCEPRYASSKLPDSSKAAGGFIAAQR